MQVIEESGQVLRWIKDRIHIIALERRLRIDVDTRKAEVDRRERPPIKTAGKTRSE